MAGKRLSITNVNEPGYKLQCIDELWRSFRAPFDAETHYARSPSTHIFVQQGFVRAVVESGVTNPFDLGMILEVLGDRQRILTDSIHPEGESLDTLHDQEAVHWSLACAHVAQRYDACAEDIRWQTGLSEHHAVV